MYITVCKIGEYHENQNQGNNGQINPLVLKYR
nr:MAG TPA: hypothetical protein [Caudoviricetes sp.]